MKRPLKWFKVGIVLFLVILLSGLSLTSAYSPSQEQPSADFLFKPTV